MDIKLCIDCVHCSQGIPQSCQRPIGTSLVDGGLVTVGIYCALERGTYLGDRCGPDGRYHSPRPAHGLLRRLFGGCA